MESLLPIVLDGSSVPFTAKDFLDKLFPNFWSFLINFLALVVLFVALYLIAYKPVKKFVDARKDTVEHNLRDAENAKAISERRAAESEQTILQAKIEAAALVDKAKKDAEKNAEAIIAQADAEAQERLKAADAAIRQAEEKSKAAVKEAIVDVALAASEKVLGREVNRDDEIRFVSEFADAIRKETGAHDRG
jgi:F-type H+-transporting ATPase subunit b